MSRNYDRINREGKLLLLLAAREAELRTPAELQKDLKPLLGPDNAKETRWGWDEFNALARGPAMALLAAKAIMPDDPLTKQAALLLLGGLDRQGIWTSTSEHRLGPGGPGGIFQGTEIRAPSPERSPSASPAPPPSNRLNSIPRASARSASIPSSS